MAVYRFRVFIEDNHEIYRDIEVKGRHDIADLHRQILAAFGFQQGQPAEYVTSDASWYAGDRVVALDGDLKGQPAKLVSHINDPHQRFLCITTSYKPVELAIELQRILKEEDEVTYPRCVKVHGDAPFYTQPPVKPMTLSDEEDEEERPSRKKSKRDEDEPTDEQIAGEDTELLNDDTETSGGSDNDDDDITENEDEDEDDDRKFSDFDVDDL